MPGQTRGNAVNLISKLNGVAQRIADNTLDQEAQETFLSDRLLNHIGSSDSKLAKFLKLKG
jgi:hypothetical protein